MSLRRNRRPTDYIKRGPVAPASLLDADLRAASSSHLPRCARSPGVKQNAASDRAPGGNFRSRAPCYAAAVMLKRLQVENQPDLGRLPHRQVFLPFKIRL
jgi:hypothetical protein